MPHSELLAAMSRPEFYPHRPEHVEVVQTHISFIFIAGEVVYKVKKAVDFGFLDFTTLEKRKFFCEEELRLNRRLAPEAYLGVERITADDAGLSLNGTGPVVEYAVRMRKLPQERMLKRLLAEGKCDAAVIDAVAAKLADFHGRAETGGRIDELGGVETIRFNHEENFSQTAAYVDITIPRGRYEFIRAFDRDFLQRQEPLLRKRVSDHRIRDCHGDLHLEHICVADGITIFDCIEFNERFRFGDVAAEVAFLAMDLDYNGYGEWAEAFVAAYIRHSGDQDIRRLLDFYRCYYAYVRGKVVGFRINDPAIDAAGRTEANGAAARYFDLAFTYAARPERPLLILTAGLMGTGKSVLAQNLAPRLGAEVLRTDVLRKELFANGPQERHTEAFGRGIYSGEFSRLTYAKALEIAVDRLKQGRSVIIDASYKRQAERLRAAETAKGLNAGFFLVECIAPEETLKARLDARQAVGRDPSDGRWDIYLAQKADFDAVTGFPAGTHLVVDTAKSPEECLEEALGKIRGLAGAAG
ncbi:MAG: bifunctional aminoglycoside phosphotransferase/ATP-binding protein [Syntrophales bacterium]